MRQLGIPAVAESSGLPSSAALSREQRSVENPTPKRYTIGVKFSLESWPEPLRELSMPSSGFELTQPQRDALHNIAFEIEPDASDEQVAVQMPDILTKCGIPWDIFSGIVEQSTAVIKTFSTPPFFKLGSRSPKDSAIFERHRGRVTHGLDILPYIATSWRAFQDLSEASIMSVGAGERSFSTILAKIGKLTDSWSDERRQQEGTPLHHLPWLWFREFRDWRPECEFRCFMRNRQFVGATQYHGVDPRTPGGQVIYPWIVENAADIEVAIKRFFQEKFLPATEGYIEGGVFDVAIDLERDEVTLIEINPAFLSTFPGLFNWETNDFDGELRWLQDHVPTTIVNASTKEIRQV